MAQGARGEGGKSDEMTREITAAVTTKRPYV